MPIMTDDEIIEYIESHKVTARGGKGDLLRNWLKHIFRTPDPSDDPRYTGDETFDIRNFPVSMKEFHFYYFGRGSNGKIRTLVYHKKGHGKPDPADLGSMIIHARTGKGPFSPEPDLDKVEWHWPGYLIFFFDFREWEFLKDRDINKSLYFAANKKKKHCGNYSFFNAKSMDLKFPNEKGVEEEWECLIVENYHFKADGQYTSRVGGAEECYKFDIYLGQSIENVTDKKMWLIIDPGGRNVGPP